MRQHIVQNFGRYILCALLMIVGLGAFGVKTVIDVEFWISQAATPEGKWQFGAASLVFCLSSLVFACVVASRLREKVTVLNAIGTALATGVLLYVTAYGMASIVGFGARERLNPYNIAHAELTARKKAVEATNALHKSYVDNQLAYLQEEGRKARGPQSKQAAYSASGDVFGSLEIKPEPVDIVSADPQATALHAMFPQYSIEQVQQGWVAAFGIGLLIVELFGMGFGVGMWPRYVPAAAETAANLVVEPVKVNSVVPVLPSAQIIHPPQFAAREPDPEPMATEPTQLELDVHEYMTSKEYVHEFWRSETLPVTGARIGASLAYQSYLSWCDERGVQGVTQQMFGRVSGKIIDRHEGAVYTYLGRALLRLNDEKDASDSLLVA